MNKINTFNPFDKDVLQLVNSIILQHPVAHLRQEEVLQTLRLIQLEEALTDRQRTSHFAVTVYQDDKRLADLSDDDKFLALLLDAECRNVFLTSKRCRYCFGGTQYSWKKIAKRCELIEVKSATLEGEYGGRFLGCGWVITPYIQRLKKWMKDNKQYLPIKQDNNEK